MDVHVLVGISFNLSEWRWDFATCAVDTDGSCVSSSLFSVDVAAAKVGISLPPSTIKLVFRFYPDRVNNDVRVDPWLKASSEENSPREWHQITDVLPENARSMRNGILVRRCRC